MGYNNTHAIENVIDILEQGPNILELKEENEKYFYLIVLNKVQEWWRIIWCKNLTGKFIIKW